MKAPGEKIACFLDLLCSLQLFFFLENVVDIKANFDLKDTHILQSVTVPCVV